MINNDLVPSWDSIPWDTHPVVKRRYTLVTPMLEWLAAIVCNWIRSGVTGAIVEGDPRRGKTRGRRCLTVMLKTEFPNILVFSLIAREYAHPSERVFFGDILRAIGHKMHLEGTAAQRRDRLTECIVRMVRRSGQNRVVLFVDQAHRLKEIQYEWLIDLFDEVNEAGIDLFVFLVGQRELSGVCDELRRAGKTQIIGRFMVDRVEFFGIRSQGELKECLAAYDDRTSFPEGSQWSYTRYFFREAFQRGWRLADLAPLFWRLYGEIRSPHAALGALEIPLQNFVSVVDRFFLEAVRGPAGDPVINEKQIAKFIAGTFSGLTDLGNDDEEAENDVDAK